MWGKWSSQKKRLKSFFLLFWSRCCLNTREAYTDNSMSVILLITSHAISLFFLKWSRITCTPALLCGINFLLCAFLSGTPAHCILCSCIRGSNNYTPNIKKKKRIANVDCQSFDNFPLLRPHTPASHKSVFAAIHPALGRLRVANAQKIFGQFLKKCYYCISKVGQFP